jgi:hypothetical protein
MTKNDGMGSAATIINGMKPQSIGRALGIGLRVAGRIAGEHLAGSSQSSGSTGTATNATAQTTGNIAISGRNMRPRAGSVAQGIGGFLRPFRRVGSIVWLEVTGVFFLLPVLVFAPTFWRIRASWLHGADHKTFLLTAGIIALFLYLSLSSFWRARRK